MASEKVTLQIELQQDTYHKILKLLHVQSYILKTDDNVTPEDFCKASISHLLKILLNSPTPEIKQHVQQYLPLTSDLPLKNRFATYVDQLGISRNRLAKQLGISKGTLSGILSNKHQPSLDVFIKLYILLGCPDFNDILYREGETE
ncbi:helix-turn-helix transcriptional regulator [Caldalkalibacillus salinus]|uniref:helix-turn-helix transcriptional regulator n=1 Tax=Caldalkalibacillus salinus TaxID=2803787 RepID=UPI0019219086|nr:helix-turn-helix transcriptional regulator [Caldalkalibacillus salinus]